MTTEGPGFGEAGIESLPLSAVEWVNRACPLRNQKARGRSSNRPKARRNLSALVG